MSQPNKNAGPDRPSGSGFAETFAKGARTPLRGLAPGRRVWKTVLGLPVLAGVGVGVVALATLGASQVRFGDGQEKPVAANRPQPAKTGSPAPATKASKSPSPSPSPASPKPSDAGAPAPAPEAPEKKTPPPKAKKPAGPPRVTYTGLVGPGCPTPPGGGYEQRGAYNDGGNGWYGLTGGSTREGGCSGQFTSVPMSGDPGKDANSSVVWWFAPGPESRSCQVSVYVPQGPNDRDVNGRPTTYQVLTDAFDVNSKYAQFTVDQAGHRGSWQPGGTFQVRQGKIAVKLLDRGVDYGPGREAAHHAAAPVKVTCHG